MRRIKFENGKFDLKQKNFITDFVRWYDYWKSRGTFKPWSEHMPNRVHLAFVMALATMPEGEFTKEK